MSHKLLIAAASLLMLTACNNDNYNDTPDTPPVTQGTNLNANPGWMPELRRLEVPRLHRGSDTILVHKDGNTVNYITEWDYQKKSQRWSCYVLNSDLRKKRASRYQSDDNQYPDDPLISRSMQWTYDPYYSNKQQFEHGHICPSADRLSSKQLNYQTFFMTNMQPQFKDFNRTLWAKLEDKVRAISNSSDTLYVCKGGTIDEGVAGKYNRVYHILDNGLLVPRYFFMALLRVRNGQYSAIGIWTDQIINGHDPGTNLARYAMSIDQLEELTGLDFFCNLPDNIEQEIEKVQPTPLAWGLN